MSFSTDKRHLQAFNDLKFSTFKSSLPAKTRVEPKPGKPLAKGHRSRGGQTRAGKNATRPTNRASRSQIEKRSSGDLKALRQRRQGTSEQRVWVGNEQAPAKRGKIKGCFHCSPHYPFLVRDLRTYRRHKSSHSSEHSGNSQSDIAYSLLSQGRLESRGIGEVSLEDRDVCLRSSEQGSRETRDQQRPSCKD